MYENGRDQRDDVQFFTLYRGLFTSDTFLSTTPLQDHLPQNFEVWSVGHESSIAIVAFHEFCPRALASTSLTVSEEFSQKETELEQCQWLNEMSGNTKIRFWITLSQELW